MSGIKADSVKAVQTIKENHGSDFFVKIGSLGGKVCVPKGFAMSKERASAAGRKDGKISRRTK